MGRDFSRVNVTIWRDQDWRNLPVLAKQLYMQLWTHPLLTYCGVVEWRPKRLAAVHPDLTVDDVQAIADCLESRLFIIVDDETEEVLIRSWARYDGLLKQPRMAVSFANAFAAVLSNDIQGVMVHELNKLKEREPDLIAWSKDKVKELFGLPSIDPRTRLVPDDPFGSHLGDVSKPLGTHLGQIEVTPTPAPAPAPAPYSSSRQKTPSSTATPSMDFETFWNAYPRKVGKQDAIKSFAKALKLTDLDHILEAVERLKKEKAGSDPKFIPHPATWLNQGRWDDEPMQAVSGMSEHEANLRRTDPWMFQ